MTEYDEAMKHVAAARAFIELDDGRIARLHYWRANAPYMKVFMGGRFYTLLKTQLKRVILDNPHTGGSE